MAGTLYTYPESFRSYKIQIAARYSGAELRVVSEPPEFELGKTNKSDTFLAKFPLGKVPAFETADGTPIFESNAIAHYVANSQLRGTTPLDAALVQQYVNFADNEILPAACTWTFPTLGIMQYNQQATKQAQECVRNCMEVLDKALATRTFLVGERVTLADITAVCNMLLLYKQVLEPPFRAPYANVNRWFVTCINQVEFSEVLGQVELCTKMAQFDAKSYQELFPKEKKKKEKKEEGQKQPKKEQPKKEQPKKAPEPEEADEDERPSEPKFKDPYLDLPKSPFNLDQFKKVYSNEDTQTKAIPFFWENFDKEGWSIWHATYNYNDDLKRIFMSSNLVSGMFQRLDKLRKYAFASVLILGEDNNNTILGIWVLRGQKLAFELVEDWNIDAESYTFTKLDPDNPEHHKMVDQYLLWEGDFGGKELADGKIFK